MELAGHPLPRRAWCLGSFGPPGPNSRIICGRLRVAGLLPPVRKVGHQGCIEAWWGRIFAYVRYSEQGTRQVRALGSAEGAKAGALSAEPGGSEPCRTLSSHRSPPPCQNLPAGTVGSPVPELAPRPCTRSVQTPPETAVPQGRLSSLEASQGRMRSTFSLIWIPSRTTTCACTRGQQRHASKSAQLAWKPCVRLWRGPWREPGCRCGEGVPRLLLAQRSKGESEIAVLNTHWSNFRALGVVETHARHANLSFLFSVYRLIFSPAKFLSFVLTPWSSLPAEGAGSCAVLHHVKLHHVFPF